MLPIHQKFEAFKYKTVKEFKSKVKELKLKIPLSTNVDILKTKIDLENIFVPNRLAIQPMEGFDASIEGAPSDLTKRRYKRYAMGGAGLIWYEATVFVEGARTNKHQLMFNENNLKQFKDLVSLTKSASHNAMKELKIEGEALLILQLNHSGRYSKRYGKDYPVRTFSQEKEKVKGNIITDSELRELEDKWVEAAILAEEAGFDGVDIKACHGYLISDLLKARLRENSDYGGFDFENRSRFLLNIIDRIFNRMEGKEFIITTRLGVYDGFPYPLGFGVKEIEGEKYPASIELTEPFKLITQLYQKGVRLINITAGNPYYRPHITRPFDIPIKGATTPDEHPLYSAFRLLDLTAQVREKIPRDMIVIGSGYSYFRQYAGYVAAGMVEEQKADLCGFGRMAFANPNFPKQIFQEGEIDKNLSCITCSKCTQRMRDGLNTGCVIRDPIYKNEK